MATNLPFTGNFEVTQAYGVKGNYAAGYHTGIDLVGKNKTIYSVCDGKVILARYYGSYGKCVKVKDSKTGNVFLFAHLSSISVKVGQTVSRVSKLGIMGNTGNSRGAHLHFEMRTPKDKYGVQYNPCEYLGIPNKKGKYNSNNYQITTYKANEIVEIRKPFTITGFTLGNNIMVQGKSLYNGIWQETQWLVNKKNVKNKIISGKAVIASVSGDKYLVDLQNGSEQFWVIESEIVK